MTLRELLDDTILRLGLCDRVDLVTLRGYLGSIEALRLDREADQQRFLQAQEPAGPTLQRYLDFEADAAVRRSSAADFAPERHLTPAGGVDPYLGLHVEYDHEGGAG